MKRPSGVIITFGLLLCFQGFAAAPSLYIQPPPNALTTVEIPLMAMPTSSDDAITETIWLDTLTIANTTAGPITVTVSDKQTSAKIILTGSMPGNSTQSLRFWGAREPNGMTWVAGGAGINVQFTGKVRR